MLTRVSSVARVVPSLARVLTPAFGVAGFASSAAVAAAHTTSMRRDRPPHQTKDGQRITPKPKRDWERRGSQRATAPEQQTTSRRLAAVPRAPRVQPPRPARATAGAAAAAAAAAASSPLHNLRGQENLILAQPRAFSAFELHTGLQAALDERLPRGQTTPIQSLSLAKLLAEPTEPVRAVLGAETGSGKTLAYLLPLLHHLKATDKGPSPTATPFDDDMVSPRALVLAPTHELTRQSTAVAKSLTHEAKLRVVGASSPGTVRGRGEVDVLFATGRSAAGLLGIPAKERERSSRPRPAPPAEERSSRPYEPEVLLDLARTEWLVIDEADVLLGPDFIDETTQVIQRVRAAAPNVHVLLVTATLPPSLLRALERGTFGKLEFEHLLSPGLHRLPRHLDTRFVPWSGGGNRLADVVHEVKRGFAEDVHDAKLAAGDGAVARPRAVVFCGSVGQVKAISTALSEKEVPALAWTGESPERTERPGHNGPLDAFLVQHKRADKDKEANASPATKDKGPRVLVTTSLLSRGLDFSSDVTAIYLVDPPRDVLDFVHRAGRAGRAGRHGRVVVFGVNGANDLKYGKEIKSVLGKTERRAAVKPGGRTWSGREERGRERGGWGASSGSGSRGGSARGSGGYGVRR